MSWLDSVSRTIAPIWSLKRQRARLALDMLRHYEAATVGRRTQGWRRPMTDANAAIAPSISMLRDVARDLVRNNGYAESGLSTIVDQAVGYGFRAQAKHDGWTRWADSTACDVDGRKDLAGISRLVMRTTAESGESLVRRLWHRHDDERLLPFQLQVLEPDFLDTLRDQQLSDGGRIIQGVEFDAQRRRRAYWLFPEHPGSRMLSSGARFGQSQRVPATDVLHVFKEHRAGQVRAVTWFAPSLLTFKDFDDLADAKLMQQKVAACLAIMTTDVDGMGEPIGEEDPKKPWIDKLAPGIVKHLPRGREVHVVNPPSVRDYPELASVTLRQIAAGLGVTPEDLTGDYGDMPFSAARMSRLKQWGRVQDWRWCMLVPQFFDPVWSWAMQAAQIVGQPVVEETEWTAPPLPMIEPDKEGLAVLRNIRTGIQTLSESLRERGFDPRQALEEMRDDWKFLDELGLVLDSQPHKMTQAGQLQGADALKDEIAELRGIYLGLSQRVEAKPRSRKRRAALPAPQSNGHDASAT